MYITKISIKNIRSIQEFSHVFEKLGDSLVLTGESGSGKSTILKCIAMGITDEDSAASVLRSLPGEFVRKGKKEGLIVIDLISMTGWQYRIRTKILSQNIFEKVFQRVYELDNHKYKSIPQNEFPWQDIFASGYGAGIRTIGISDYRYYVAIDALFSLFSHDTPLQNPELAIRRIVAMAEESGTKDAGKHIEQYLTEILFKVLNLNKDDKVILTSSSIEVKTKKFGQHELNTLGDGQLSTITWVLDLFSWWMLYLKQKDENIINHKEINGIVIIDGIEKHIDPSLQKILFKILKEMFPKIQFLTSTDSQIIIDKYHEICINI